MDNVVYRLFNNNILYVTCKSALKITKFLSGIDFYAINKVYLNDYRTPLQPVQIQSQCT